MSGYIIEELAGACARPLCDDHTMAREAYHRVSNHLQILASLINLEARQRPGGEATEALLQVRRRILAIARLQSELQRIDEEGMVDAAALLDRLSGDLRLCFDVDSSDLLEVSSDAGYLPAETAATVVLIINELVTNSLNSVLSSVLAAGSSDTVTLVSEVETRSTDMPCSLKTWKASARKPTWCHMPGLSREIRVMPFLVHTALTCAAPSNPSAVRTVPSISGT